MTGYRSGLDPDGPAPECDHGEMLRKTGINRKGTHWAGFFCPESAPSCKPQWVDVSTIIAVALNSWREMDTESDAA